jgi:hypothetical protein
MLWTSLKKNEGSGWSALDPQHQDLLRIQKRKRNLKFTFENIQQKIRVKVVILAKEKCESFEKEKFEYS